MAGRSFRSLSERTAARNEELQRTRQDVCAGMDRMEFLAHAAESYVCCDLNLWGQPEKQLLDGNGAVAQPDAVTPTKVRVDKDGNLLPRAAGHLENGSPHVVKRC